MVLEVAAEEVNRRPTSAAACLSRPRCRASPLVTDRPARALATIRNGKKHNSRVAANSMPRLMKSIASSRRHRCSADEPAYFPLAASVPRRTRPRTPCPPFAAPSGDFPSCPADAISLRPARGGPAAPTLMPAPGVHACGDHRRWRHPRLIRPPASSRAPHSSPGVSLIHPKGPGRPGLPHQARADRPRYPGPRSIPAIPPLRASPAPGPVPIHDPQGCYEPDTINRYHLAAWMPLRHNTDGSPDLHIQETLRRLAIGDRPDSRARTGRRCRAPRWRPRSAMTSRPRGRNQTITDGCRS